MPRAKVEPRRYAEEEKKAALELGAAVGRNAAVRQLGISKSTFQQWTELYPELWSDLRRGDREAQKLGIAGRLEDLAEQYTSLEFEALERAEKLIKTADAKELAALIKAMGGSRGVASVGARALRGEDAERVEHNINFPQIEQALERVLAQAPQPALVVENEAEREDDAGGHD
jgi:hypothetical protein